MKESTKTLLRFFIAIFGVIMNLVLLGVEFAAGAGLIAILLVGVLISLWSAVAGIRFFEYLLDKHNEQKSK